MTASHRTPYERVGVNPKARKMTLDERTQVLSMIEGGMNPEALRVWMSEELGIDRRAQTIEQWYDLKVGEPYPGTFVTKNKAAKMLGVSVNRFNVLVRNGIVDVATGSPSRQRFDPEHIEDVKGLLFGGVSERG